MKLIESDFGKSTVSLEAALVFLGDATSHSGPGQARTCRGKLWTRLNSACATFATDASLFVWSTNSRAVVSEAAVAELAKIFLLGRIRQKPKS